ncbi:MAG: glycosyltransferase [Cyclobacteriaceae bacterium]|nr:glycosyltransferase [Cyclobacteriaceae bacterium]
MTWLLAAILILYIMLVIALLIGWVRIRRQPMPPRTANPPGVSVVIAFRNEAPNVGNLIRDLAGSAFPAGRFEVILVDDHSEDNSAEVVNQAASTSPQVRLLKLPAAEHGKKAALRLGISQARFSIIATTDADCTLSKNWLTCVASYFEEETTKLLLGPVKLSDDGTFFGQVQVLEFVSVAGTTAATVGLGHPVMANGANLAFRKEVFEEVGGYEDNLVVPSGDDEFLMRKVFARYPHGVRYLNYYEAAVSTPPQPDLASFVHQRMRWAGKWRHNPDWVARGLAVFILVAQFSFLALLFINLRNPEGSSFVVVLKVFVEGVFIAWMGRFLDRPFHAGAFLLIQLVYPIYVMIIGIGSLFLSYQWKGRRHLQG